MSEQQQVRIAETRVHQFKGDFPTVPTYSHVDTAMLEEGEPLVDGKAKPCYITLPIAEIGRVADSGLEYDDALVTTIAEQMQYGAGGIRGHLTDEELPTAFPVDDVHWVGHLMEGNTLWAKGYIPPGESRNDIRRKIARGGTIGTSIYGAAIREMSAKKVGRPTWRAKNFVLDQVDLAPANRASLRNRHGAVITREMTDNKEGTQMPEVTEIRDVNDVPVTIREQIARQAVADADRDNKLGRVAEMETELGELRPLKEMARYKSIVAEIRSTVGDEADMVQVLTNYHAQMTKLAEMMGVPYSNIVVKVEEMHEQVAEMRRKEFDGVIDTRVAEMTPWNAANDTAKQKVTAFRSGFRRAIVAGIGTDTANRTPEKVAEIAQGLWDSEFGLLAPGIIREIAGPAALIPSKPNTVPTTGDSAAKYRTPEGQKEVKDNWNIPSPG